MSEPNREAVEAAARAMCDDGCNWDNELPGRRKTMWLDRAEIALKAALPHLAPQPTQSDEEAGEDAYAETELRMARAEHDPFAPMRAFAAAVRAEATIVGAVAERAQNAALLRARASELEGSHKLIMLGAADEIKARTP